MSHSRDFYSFLYFYAYSFLRKLVQKRQLASSVSIPGSGNGVNDIKKAASLALSVPQELGIGFLAGVLSRLVSTPLSVITVRLQSESVKDDRDDGEGDVGILATARNIYRDDGLFGFWKGWYSKLPTHGRFV